MLQQNSGWVGSGQPGLSFCAAVFKSISHALIGVSGVNVKVSIDGGRQRCGEQSRAEPSHLQPGLWSVSGIISPFTMRPLKLSHNIKTWGKIPLIGIETLLPSWLQGEMPPLCRLCTVLTNEAWNSEWEQHQRIWREGDEEYWKPISPGIGVLPLVCPDVVMLHHKVTATDSLAMSVNHSFAPGTRKNWMKWA